MTLFGHRWLFSVTTNIRLRCNSKSVYVYVTGSCGKQCASEDVHLLSLPMSDHWPGPDCCYFWSDYFCYVVTAVIVTVGLIYSEVTVSMLQVITVAVDWWYMYLEFIMSWYGVWLCLAVGLAQWHNMYMSLYLWIVESPDFLTPRQSVAPNYCLKCVFRSVMMIPDYLSLSPGISILLWIYSLKCHHKFS